MSGAPQKTCFVVMGFGEKTDFLSTPQRTLNLDKTYENIIKPTVEEADLKCIRADEIIHSTIIDKPMYERLLDADVVIADLSTTNANAIYELGVRHALRPYTTIVMAESAFKFPFDLSHLSILKYEHLGKDIGYDEVMRVRAELRSKLAGLVNNPQPDSPVFLFLPSLGAVKEAVLDESNAAAPRTDASVAELVSNLREAKKAVRVPADWLEVAVYAKMLKRVQPDDPYVVQQLALATYKSQQPDSVTALQQAREVLLALAPEISSDAETVGLWGAIHKRLWEVNGGRADLDRAIAAYERGLFLRYDYYNGINYAFLLDVRASLSDGEEATTDHVLAKRVRREVLRMCDGMLTGTVDGATKPEKVSIVRNEQLLVPGALEGDAKFWVEATRIEALLGLGRTEESDAALANVLATNPPPAPWMVGTLSDQLTKLRGLLPKA